MTLHINDDLLHRAMRVAGVTSKTSAIDIALREFVRRSELVRVLTEGLSKDSAELASMFEPDYDIEPLRAAETPTPYGRKPGAGR